MSSVDFDEYVSRLGRVGARPDGGPSEAVKAFDSTGSKLTAVYDEVRYMSEVRRPDQYVFAVVDGIGWHNRKEDLRRIHALCATRAIDGLYTLSMLDDFRRDLRDAAVRVGILAPT